MSRGPSGQTGLWTQGHIIAHNEAYRLQNSLGTHGGPPLAYVVILTASVNDMRNTWTLHLLSVDRPCDRRRH